MAVDKKVVVEIDVSASKGAKSIKELKAELKALREEIEASSDRSSAYVELIDKFSDKQKELSVASREFDEALGKQRKSLGGINEAFDFTNASLGELFQRQKQLKNEILVPTKNSESVKVLSEELNAVNAEIKAFQNTIKGVPDSQTRFTNAIESSQKALTNSNVSINELQDSLKELKKVQSDSAISGDRFQQATEQINKLQTALDDAKLQAKQFADAAKGIEPVDIFVELEGADLSLNQLKDLKKQLEKGIGDLKIGTDDFDKFSAQLLKVNTTLAEQQRQLKGTMTLQEAFEAALKNSAGAIESESKSLGALNDSLNELKKIQSQLDVGSDEFKKITAEAIKLENAIEGVKDEIKSIENEIKGTGDKIADAFKKMEESITSTFDQVKGLVIAAFATESLESFISSVGEAVTELDKFRAKIGAVSGEEATNEQIATVRALSQTYEEEGDKIVVSANKAAKAFGISFDDALKLVDKGLKNGANAQGEFIDNIGEFGRSFKDAGFSADQFFKFVEKTQKAGLQGSVGEDLIKNFNEKIKEQTDSTKEALTGAFGEAFSKDLLQRVNTGATTTIQAIQEVSDKLSTSGLSTAQKGTLFADVFGTAVDVGEEFVVSLRDIDKELASNTTKLTQAQQAQIKLADANKGLNLAFAELSEELGGAANSFETIKAQTLTFIVQGLTKLIATLKAIPAFLKENKEELIALGVAITALNFGKVASGVSNLVGAFNTLRKSTVIMTAAQAALNLVMTANPIGLVVAAVATLTAGIIYLYKNSETARKVLDSMGAVLVGLSKIIYNLGATYISGLVGHFTALYEIVVGIFTFDFERAGAGVIKVFTNIRDTVLGFVNSITGGADEITKSLNEISKVDASGKIVANAKKSQKELDAIRKESEQKRLQGVNAQKATDEQLAKATSDARKAGLKDLEKTFSDELNMRKKKAAETAAAANKEAQEAAKAAADRFKELQKAADALRLKVRIEVAGGEDTLKGIEELRKQALDAQKKEDGFTLLSKQEQNALLLKIEKEFQDKKLALLLKASQESSALQTALFQRERGELDRQAQLRLSVINKGEADALRDAELTEEARKEIQIKFAQERLTEERKQADARLLLNGVEFDKRRALINEQAEIEKKIIAEGASKGALTPDKAAEETAKAEQKRLNDLAALRAEQFASALEREKQITEFKNKQFELDKQRLEIVEAFRKNEFDSSITKLLKDGSLQEATKQVQEFFDKEIELAGRNTDKIKQLETERQNAIKRIQEEALKAQEKQRERLTKATETGGFSARLKAIKELYKFEQELAKGNADKIKEIEKDKNEAIAAEYDKLFNTIREHYQEAASIVSDITSAVTENQIEEADAQIEVSQKTVDANNERIEELQTQEEKATGRRKKQIQAQIKALEKQNEQEVELQKKAEEEKTQAARTAAIIEKAIAIGNIVINTAQAIAAAVAASPLTGGLPFSAIAGVIGATQLAAVIATSFAQGGVLKGQKNRGGVFKGRSHAEGGIVLNGGAVEVENDEIVLTKGVYRDPLKRSLASALNVSAGGVPFAYGGVITRFPIPTKLQAGGLAPDLRAISLDTQLISNSLETLGERIEGMQPVVSVEEINRVSNQVTVIENRAKF